MTAERRVESSWSLAPAADLAPGTMLHATGSVRPLWPGIEHGRPAPVFSHPMSGAEYLQFEGSQTETRHEYVDGFVYAMAGASDAHVRIAMNLTAALHQQVRKAKCRAYQSDMRLHARTKKDGDGYYYPDYFITCSKNDFGADANMIKSAPCLVVEIASSSTALTDRTEKLDHYRKIRTVQQYWLIDQKEARVVVHTRDGTRWIETEHSSMGEVLSPLAGVEISIEEIYQDIFD